MKKDILITGSEGYIGTNLRNYLSPLEYNIFQVDKKIGVPAEEIKDFKVFGDKIHTVVHLAALPGIKACQNNIRAAIQDNVISASNILNIAQKERIQVIFFSSQAAENKESSIYARMKNTVESYAETLNLDTFSNIKILRIANVYGGIEYLEKKDTVIKRFITAYRNNDYITIDGDGIQTRDFIHVEDVCKYVSMCIEMNHTKFYKPIDIGTGIQTSINELAEMFKPYDKINYDKKSRSIGVNTNYADIKDEINIFGFKAENKLQQYINDMKGRENV